MKKELSKGSLDCRHILIADLFATLLKGEQAFVVSHSSILQLRKGAFLFSAGQKADHFYMLLEGFVRIFKRRLDEDGEDEVARFMPGDIIGDFDFASHAKYDAYAEAFEDAVLIMFPGYGLGLDDLANESPHTISKILLGSVVMMTERIKSTRKIIVENMSWVQELHRKAYEDPGTGLWKQTFLVDEINRILENPSALIMLKPDRFKTLVDGRGHGAGDDAMVRIAMILRNITRRLGRGWPLRFKSNETGLLINKCDASQAASLTNEIAAAVAALSPVPAVEDVPEFRFTGTIAWGVWPADEVSWDELFRGTYDLLLAAWKDSGNIIVRYSKDVARRGAVPGASGAVTAAVAAVAAAAGRPR